MDACEKILQEGEVKNYHLNEYICNLVLGELSNNIENSVLSREGITGESKIRLLKDELNTPEDIAFFYEVLSKYNYNMTQDIIDAMSQLGHLSNPSQNKEVIEKLLHSPVIQDINFNGNNKFTITSQEYGDVDFVLASEYFRDNKKIANYIKKNSHLKRCHNHTYFMAEQNPDYYAITSLCQYLFKNTYHHSYTCDKDNQTIIDLCYNSIMDKEQYEQIFQPEEVSVILNSQVDKELALTSEKTEQYFARSGLLKIALYKEYLQSIGYEGSLEDAPIATAKTK